MFFYSSSNGEKIILQHLFFIFPASIFAYGQTSSGKTYTMTGITEYTVADIFDYVHRVMEVLHIICSSSNLPFTPLVIIFVNLVNMNIDVSAA